MTAVPNWQDASPRDPIGLGGYDKRGMEVNPAHMARDVAGMRHASVR